jgi:phage baseplate assembly protein W
MTDQGRLFGRGIAFPPRVGPDGRVASSAGEDNIRESITIILKTELRERVMSPEFGGGLQRFLFEPNTVTTRHQIAERIVRALALWERRIAVSSVDVTAHPDEPNTAVATINYKLVATQGRERLTLAVTLSS